MNDTVKGTLVGDPIEAPVDAKPPKTRAERFEDWKRDNQAAYAGARERCCMCSPSRADLLLVDQFEGNANPPID